LQIRRVKSLGEPAVNLGQHRAGFLLLPLQLPQAGQADRRPQFQRPGRLPVGNINRMPKIFLCLSLGAWRSGPTKAETHTPSRGP